MVLNADFFMLLMPQIHWISWKLSLQFISNLEITGHYLFKHFSPYPFYLLSFRNNSYMFNTILLLVQYSCDYSNQYPSNYNN